MLELVTATATHMETQHGGGPAPRLRGPNAERQLLKHGSAGSNVIRMPSFGTSLASVDLEEDASQNATSDGDSALLQVMQKYTRDTSALKFLLEVRHSKNLMCSLRGLARCGTCLLYMYAVFRVDVSHASADVNSVIMHQLTEVQCNVSGQRCPCTR